MKTLESSLNGSSYCTSLIDLTGDDAAYFWQDFKSRFSNGDMEFIRMDGGNTYFNLYLLDKKTGNEVCINRTSHAPGGYTLAFEFRFQLIQRSLMRTTAGDQLCISEQQECNVYDEIQEWWTENGIKFYQKEVEKYRPFTDEERNYFLKFNPIPEERWIGRNAKGTGASRKHGIVTIDNFINDLKRYRLTEGGEMELTEEFVRQRFNFLKSE